MRPSVVAELVWAFHFHNSSTTSNSTVCSFHFDFELPLLLLCMLIKLHAGLPKPAEVEVLKYELRKHTLLSLV